MEVKFSDSVTSLSYLKDWLQQLTTEYDVEQFQIITEHRFQRIKSEERRLPDRYTCVALVKRMPKPIAAENYFQMTETGTAIDQ